VDVNEALEFARQNHRCFLVTRRRDDSLQTSPSTVVARGDQLWISSRETAFKVRNLRRDPSVTVTIVSDGWYGPWVQVGRATHRLVIVPTASMVVVTVSPGCRKVRLAAPTPDGVPVKIRSPGTIVVMEDR